MEVMGVEWVQRQKDSNSFWSIVTTGLKKIHNVGLRGYVYKLGLLGAKLWQILVKYVRKRLLTCCILLCSP